MRHLIIATSILAFTAIPGASVAADGRMPLVTVTGSSESAITAPLYYSQIKITANGFNPTEEEKKKLGKEILSALGLRKETRSVLVSLAIKGAGISYPDIPILSYTFDGSRKLTDISAIRTKTLPLQRIAPFDKYEISLTYKYSDKIEFDVNKATNELTALVPSSSLAAVATKPFFESVGRLSSSILSLAGSQDTTFRLSDEMSPYKDNQNKLVIALAKPTGGEFGTVTLDLHGTATLNRPTSPLTELNGNALKKREGEDVSLLSLNIGGSRRYLLAEVKGVEGYGSFGTPRDENAVKSYCVSARSHLDTQFSLTAMDRVMLVYRALNDAGFTLSAPNNSWYFACFNSDERAALKLALDLDPTLIIPSPAGTAYAIPTPIKYALGCHITGLQGRDCSTNAPNARLALLEAFSPEVVIDQLEMPLVVDLANLPANRTIKREDLLDGLAGKAARFGCFPRGLILTGLDEQSAYALDVDEAGGRISKIRIRSVPPSTINCT